eukprot:7381818-Prymnesium_polylepis.1
MHPRIEMVSSPMLITFWTNVQPSARGEPDRCQNKRRNEEGRVIESIHGEDAQLSRRLHKLPPVPLPIEAQVHKPEECFRQHVVVALHRQIDEEKPKIEQEHASQVEDEQDHGENHQPQVVALPTDELRVVNEERRRVGSVGARALEHLETLPDDAVVVHIQEEEARGCVREEQLLSIEGSCGADAT